MKVAANFILEFAQPEKGALRYLSHAISHNYLESMPVYKNTLLRDGRFVYCNKCSSNLQLKSIQVRVFYNNEADSKLHSSGIECFSVY